MQVMVNDNGDDKDPQMMVFIDFDDVQQKDLFLKHFNQAINNMAEEGGAYIINPTENAMDNLNVTNIDDLPDDVGYSIKKLREYSSKDLTDEDFNSLF